ncbi:YceI family protein [Dyadobacter sp. LJ53]|uniref:YceI family protein n=1 Tax=Dyadobacter chenwenxiniae TaxID=2906456 RepID=UPI001F24DB92|nr:YceI family protein [Dyadobacter chenwenxiniae]MCF0048953.1 YceI family protein [Dyadobacter chenwenxiniae]
METANKTKWVIDPTHSEVGFKLKHLMVSTVRGVFKEYDASIYTTNEDFLTAEVDFWINPASIDTGNAQRDAHLRNSDFFDTENFKEINFTGNTYEVVDNSGNYKIYGELTIKGISKQVKLAVEFGGIIKDPWGKEKAIFSVTGTISRKDWGLNWNMPLETGGLLVSDEISINVELQLARQS